MYISIHIYVYSRRVAGLIHVRELFSFGDYCLLLSVCSHEGVSAGYLLFAGGGGVACLCLARLCY